MADLLASTTGFKNNTDINVKTLKSLGLKSKEDLEMITDTCIAFASAHGLMVASTATTGGKPYTHAPLSLLPAKVGYMFFI